MRKNLLGLSIAAMIGGLGLAGNASAGVSIAGTGVASATTADRLVTGVDGIGHILLAPYFTTQAGNNTLISIVNTDTINGKAVKVRFRGAANSDDIYDFQVYMSPGDVWTANVSQNAAGLSQLTTNDNSCTLPNRSTLNSTPFVVGRLPAAVANQWTREGYIEIFNMADIVMGGAATTLGAQIKHASGIAPGCPAGLSTGAALGALNVDLTSEADAVAKGFNTPTTGLMGSTTIINVFGGAAAWTANMDALVAVNTAALPLNANGDFQAGRGRIVFSPQTSDGIVDPAVINTLTNDPLLRNTGTLAVPVQVVAAANYDLPDLSTPYVGTGALTQSSPFAQAEALAKALAVNSVKNEYLTTGDGLTAATDWTFTMPTRRYAVAMNYTPATPTLVFNATASSYFTAANSTRSGNLICVNPGAGTSATSFGRDEQSSLVTTGFVISPSTPAPSFSFCGEASVLAFAPQTTGTSVLGATIAVNSPGNLTSNSGVAGWQNIPTPGLSAGLPILGSAYVKVSGPVSNGASTNFSQTFGHRFTRPAN